jgi:tartrate dehydratase alpha subunit/fumarate hydratase class I-like protein
VKETTPSGYLGSIEMKGKIVHQIESPKQNNEVEDTIQNGVKETKENRLLRTINVISTIKNGVKHVEDGDWLDQDERIDDIIENGVKETKESMLESLEQIDHQVTNSEITENINDAIENGVKKTKEISNISLMSEIFKVNAKQAIRDGVKELKELPDKSGEFRGYGDWYRRQGNMTKPHTEYVKEVIEDSYNHRGRVEGIIRNTDKDGI